MAAATAAASAAAKRKVRYAFSCSRPGATVSHL